MKATIYPVLLATMQDCDYSHNVYGERFGEKVQAGMLGFVIAMPDALAVFDTGPDVARWNVSGKGILGDPERSFRTALAKIGKAPADVNFVILSHLHSDHIGNWKLFPNATIVIHRKEMAYAAAPIYALYYEAAEISELVAVRHRIRYIDEDGVLTHCLELMLLGGHSPGGMCALVATQKYENLDTRSTTITNVDEWILSLRRLKERADLILPGHEIRVMEDYPVL